MRKKISIIMSLCLLFTSFNFTFADSKTVSVTIPKFSVTLNNVKINNAQNKYPTIVYKDITYFPMTYSYSTALGLKTSWDNTNGFGIEKGVSKSADVVQDLTGNNTLGKNYTASLPNFKITVNNKIVDNSKEEYPLLVFRDVTYFPMTWKFAVTEFGLKTDWDNTNGFFLSSTGEIKKESVTQSDSEINSSNSLFKFRNTTWGASRSSVIQSENKNPDYMETDSIVYADVPVAGFNANLLFAFKNDYLYNGYYIFTHNHTNNTDYISDFFDIEAKLINLYGNPLNQNVLWKGDLWKDDPKMWGMAVITGDLEYTTTWDVKNTLIMLALSGDNYQVNFRIMYVDKNVFMNLQENNEGL